MAAVYFSKRDSANMTTKICKSVFAALIEDLKDVNNHNFDLLEVKVESNEKGSQIKRLNPLNDLDNYDSDNETFSERNGGFLFKKGGCGC